MNRTLFATVFLDATLVLSTAIGVLAGGLLGRHLVGPWLARLAGLGFLAVGIWTIWRAWQPASRPPRG